MARKKAKGGFVPPWDDIPDSDVTLPAYYHGVVAKMEKGETDDGRVYYSAQIELKEPPGAQGYHFDRFWLGTDDDPEAQDPQTWKQREGRRLKRFFKAAGVFDSGTTAEEMADEAEGQDVGMKVRVYTRKSGDRAGQEANDTEYMPAGECEPEWLEGAPSSSKPKPKPAPKKAAAKKPKPKPEPEPEDEEEEEEEEDDDDLEDDEEEEGESEEEEDEDEDDEDEDEEPPRKKKRGR